MLKKYWLFFYYLWGIQKLLVSILSSIEINQAGLQLPGSSLPNLHKFSKMILDGSKIAEASSLNTEGLISSAIANANASTLSNYS